MVRKENLDLSDENMMEDNEMGNLDEEESELESKSGEDEDVKLAEECNATTDDQYAVTVSGLDVTDGTSSSSRAPTHRTAYHRSTS